jgi:hypothetical protein
MNKFIQDIMQHKYLVIIIIVMLFMIYKNHIRSIEKFKNVTNNNKIIEHFPWTERCFAGHSAQDACKKAFGEGSSSISGREDKCPDNCCDAIYECTDPAAGGKVKQITTMEIENDKLIINESKYEMLNSNTNKYLAKSVTNLASSCSGSADAKQEVNFSGNTVGGDANIGISQKMEAQLNFTCVNASEVNREVGADLSNRLSGMVQDTTDTSVLNDMSAKAELQQATTGGDQPAPETTQEQNTKIKNSEEIRNILNAKMSNIVDNTFESENITNDTKECIAAATASQEAIFQDNVFGGNLNLNVEQELSLKVVADCANKNNMGEKVVQKVLQETFGDFEKRAAVTSETKMEASVKMKQTATAGNKTNMAGASGSSLICCCCSVLPIVAFVLL